jgi:hypothetical protein
MLSQAAGDGLAEVRERLQAISPEAAQAIREAVAAVAGARQAAACESSPS